MKKAFITSFVVVAILVAYFAGPKFEKPTYSKRLPDLQLTVNSIDDYIVHHESLVKVRPDNEARIIWYNDSLKNQTEYCLLYLHGFSASWYEGNPAHINVASDMKANLYLSRLAAHGLEDRDAFLYMTPDSLYESAKEALMIANTLGRKVVIMSTSTGGTLALKLAADFPDKINGLILLSPNIEINNPVAFLLNAHWGINLARKSGGGELYRHLQPGLPIENKYWYSSYRWEGTVYLQQLIETTMKQKVFKQVKQPVFVGYYYRDKEHQDPVVKVSAILKMYDELGTPSNLKRKVAFEDANNHVIACAELSGCASEVEHEVEAFIHSIIITDNP